MSLYLVVLALLSPFLDVVAICEVVVLWSCDFDVVVLRGSKVSFSLEMMQNFL